MFRRWRQRGETVDALLAVCKFSGKSRPVKLWGNRVPKRIVLLCLLAVLAAPLNAQTLLDRAKKGVSDATDAVGKGAKTVGSAVGKGVDIVGDTVSSTNELLSDEETPEQTRAKLDRMADDILARLLADSAEARDMFEVSAGYAAFDTRRITVFPLTAGYGRGVAVSASDGARTYMQMGKGGVGAAFGIGGFEHRFVIMFETPVDFDRFVTSGYDATADAGAMHGDDATDQKVRFVQGRSFFVLGKTGWRVNADATGTKYWKDTDLN